MLQSPLLIDPVQPAGRGPQFQRTVGAHDSGLSNLSRHSTPLRAKHRRSLGRMSKVRPIAAKLTSDPISAYTRSVAAKESGAALTHPRGPIGHIDRDCNNKDGEQSTRRSSMGLK